MPAAVLHEYPNLLSTGATFALVLPVCSWRTSLAWAFAIFTQTVIRFGALYVAVYAYVWYENLEQVPYSGRWRSVRPTMAERAQEQGPREHEEVGAHGISTHSIDLTRPGTR